MAKFEAGTVIGIPCEVKPGPFSEERFISFDTTDGPVTGFVRETDLNETDHRWRVRAVVVNVLEDVIEVRVRGSFFTTNGLATIQRSAAVAA